ncbi:MAG: serine/threonine protein kinase [Deltaproteobacteria bacterium]|nr:serine/threonine protein kinase [Deltaproteobacteria bacterium]
MIADGKSRIKAVHPRARAVQSVHLVETLLKGVRVGAHQVECELGSTRTGVLYEVVHIVLPRRSVMKVAHSLPLGVQLLREACLVAAIQHPGMPIVFDSGVLPGGRPWFAIERIDGDSLAEQQQLDAVQVAAIVRDVADILAHAHRRGVFHLALRPYRILLTPNGRFPVSIPDWSMARTHDALSSMSPLPPSAYDAPEVVRGEPVDGRADVFALGVIAYAALSGVEPFADDTAYVPLRTRCPAAPPELTVLIDQMLAEDPSERPTAAEVHGDLVELVVDVVETPTAPVPMRMRKPRWTPPMTFAAVGPASDDEIEIDLDEAWVD